MSLLRCWVFLVIMTGEETGKEATGISGVEASAQDNLPQQSLTCQPKMSVVPKWTKPAIKQGETHP
jgi:hypothetical protein